MMKAKISEGDSLVIPDEVKRALGVVVGDTLVLDVEGGELRLKPLTTAIERVQAALRELVPEGVSLSDELIADRRAEATRE